MGRKSAKRSHLYTISRRRRKGGRRRTCRRKYSSTRRRRGRRRPIQRGGVAPLVWVGLSALGTLVTAATYKYVYGTVKDVVMGTEDAARTTKKRRVDAIQSKKRRRRRQAEEEEDILHTTTGRAIRIFPEAVPNAIEEFFL